MFVKRGLLLFAVISVLVIADNPNNISNQNVEDKVGFGPQPRNVTDGPPINPNITTTTSRPTTTTKITTTTSPNTTTTAPTTPNPNTTTTAPTTPNPNTTTTATTTTTPTPSTSIPPTPKPDNTLSVNSYTGNYTNSSNICLMAKLAIQIEILNNKENSTFINVPKNVSYTITCAPNSSLAYLTINFNKQNDSVHFQFFRNDSKYEIQSINTTLLVDGQNTTTNLYHAKPEFSISEKLSYYCMRDQALNLTNGISNETLAKIHFSHVQYQAFMNSTNAHYSSVWDCDGVNTPDIVPVVVGCVLAILVVLVLVVYLFGRRRCQARGYLSMFTQERSDREYIPMKTLSCFQ